MTSAGDENGDRCRLHVGTSGWNYDHWKTGLYAGVKRRDRLRRYAERFNAVEINATFYRLQAGKTTERWYAETPADFRFCIKGHRYLTHNRKLRDPLESIGLEREHARGLGEKLAAVLWQLPATFHRDVDRLQEFAEALGQWREPRHAVEFRHDSWFDDGVAACLEEHDIANCMSDAADWPMWDEVTTDLVYLRLHGRPRTYASAYSDKTLSSWASRISAWLASGREVHVYFDNDAAGTAPRDAVRLKALLSRP